MIRLTSLCTAKDVLHKAWNALLPLQHDQRMQMMGLLVVFEHACDAHPWAIT